MPIPSYGPVRLPVPAAIPSDGVGTMLHRHGVSLSNAICLPGMPCSLPRWTKPVRVSVASRLVLPSPFPRRVGVHDFAFEACSSFTRVTACRVARPPYSGLCHYIDRRPEHMLPLMAVEPNRVFRIRTESILPPEQREAFMRDRQGLALGRAVANRLSLKLGQRITVQGDTYPVDLELIVRAIYEGPDDIEAYFHWKYLQESLPPSYKGLVTTFSVRARTPRDVPRIAQAVDEQFRNSPQPTRTETEKAFMVSFIGMIGNIKLFLLSIAGAIMFTILLVAANTMAMSVRERIREIGVPKTLGFSSTSVLAMIMCESAIIAILGGLFGVTLSYLATQALANEIVMYIQGFTMPLWAIPICMAVALVLGLLSAVIPAAAAARTTIADALRHGG